LEAGAKTVAVAEESPAETRDSLVISAAGLITGLIQGACAILVASSSMKILLSVAGLAAAMKASRFHSDPVRIPVMVVSAILACISLYVLWNGRRLRNLPSARWRKRPLSRRQKLAIAFTLASSLATLALVIAESVIHPVIHL
jgi:hypothetical protein